MAHPWITPETTLDRAAFYYFRKKIICPKDAVITLSVSADTRYLLTVNGNYVCEGPCISDTVTRKYETVTVPNAFLRGGANEVCVRVLYLPPTDPGFFSGIRGERPVLWLEGTVTIDGEAAPFAADGTWTCLVDYGTELTTPETTHLALPPTEHIHTPGDLRETGIRPYAENRMETGNFDKYGLTDLFEMEERPIPLLKPEAPRPFAEIRRGDTYLELDAGVYTTAYPSFAFRGPKGGEVRITYAECYVYKKGDGYTKGKRDATDGILRGAFDTVALTGEKQTFVPYWYKAFRFVRLDFPAGTEVCLDGQSYRPYFYPLETEASFACDQESRNAMWTVSKNTLLCSAHETFVDCPYYEQCQYDMDSAIEAAVMLRLTGDTRLVRKSITDLSRSQRRDGLLLAHYPSIRTQVIPGFSIFWIRMLEEYVLYTGDTRFAQEMLPVAEGILTFFRMHRTKEGLCENTRFWNFVDWVPSWPNGVPAGEREKPLTVATLLYAAGCRSAARLAGWAGREALAGEYLRYSEEANAAVKETCFDEKRGMFVDVPGRTPAFSEHTTVWAVLSGCVEGEEAKRLVDATFGGGEVSRASFSFNYYTFRALEKAGRYAEYADRLFTGWRWMLEQHCTTWCENPDDPRSECHGWSSAPLYENSAMVLGVRPLTPGCTEIGICPDTDGFAWAEGSVPTPMGFVSVKWKRGEALTVEGPLGQVKRIRLPGREEIVSDKGTVRVDLG